MPSLSSTIARMAALRDSLGSADTSGTDRLSDLVTFGSNPGALRARVHIPEALPDGAALVVVLHGCTQTAGGYDRGAGWSDMADRHGFALLFPEQQRANNANLCFNWFNPDDCRRGSGEALSIRQMVTAVVATHRIDPARVFVTGLSAGGAMTAVMLATYPEVFAGGAIIAGLPYGCARSVPEALERMRGQGLVGGAALAARVRDASGHAGPWPTLSVWHGSADATVKPVNADAVVDQWRGLHGVAATPDRTDTIDGYPRRMWRDAGGRDVIEAVTITGMGHGTPLDTGSAEGCGESGAHMLDVGISSTQHICRFWGLADAPSAARTMARPFAAGVSHPLPGGAGGVGKVIEDALRTAGLMR